MMSGAIRSSRSASTSGIFRATDYGMVADGTTDAAAPMRAAVAAAAGFITTTGRGAVIELPPGRLAWNVFAPFSAQPPFQVSNSLGVALPVNLVGRLTIKGRGRGATTIVLSDTCRNAFYPAINGANIHATTVNGNSTITVTSVPQGTIRVGDMVTGAGIPGGTVISSYNSGTGALVLGLASNSATPVNATADGTNIGLLSIGRDIVKNITFEDFDVDNNGAIGRCDILFGNRPQGNNPMNYLSYEGLRFRRLGCYNVPFDATQNTTYKQFIGLIGGHATNDLISTWNTWSKDILCEDIDIKDAQGGILIASFVPNAVNHYYDKIKIRNCSVDHIVANSFPSSTLSQSSFLLCGAGYGDDLEIVGCFSNGSADDGIEIGAMQNVLIDRCTIRDSFLAAIFFRQSQDAPYLSSQSITVRDTAIEVTSVLATSSSAWGRAFMTGVDTSGNGIGTCIGNIYLERVTYKISDVPVSKLNRTQGDFGFGFAGSVAQTQPIRSVHMSDCVFHTKNVNYDKTTTDGLSVILSNLVPPLMDNLAGTQGNQLQYSPAVHTVRDFTCVMEGGGAISTGSFTPVGVLPIGQGVIDVDGFDWKLTDVAGGTALLAPQYATLWTTASTCYSSQRFRRFRGQRTNSSASAYGFRVYNTGITNGTLAHCSIDECDFRSWTQTNASLDIEYANAGGFMQNMIRYGKFNRWNTNSTNGSTANGGSVQAAAGITAQVPHTAIGITDTTFDRTITLPPRFKFPQGIENALTIIDETNALSTNGKRIIALAVGSDTFVGGATSKSIGGNGSSLRVYNTGSNWDIIPSIDLVRRTVAANLTMASTDTYVGVTNTTAIRTITLPAASAVTPGATYTIKDESGAAGNPNVITVLAGAGDTIEGVVSKDITIPYGFLRLFSNGTKWLVV